MRKTAALFIVLFFCSLLNAQELSFSLAAGARRTSAVQGAGISAEVDISLYPGSNEAYAVISPNFNSRTIRLEGRLVPYEQSRVYEGMSF